MLCITDENNILHFIEKGSELQGVTVGMKRELVFDLVGKPDRVVGDSVSGFYEYNSGLRYRYVDDHIDELAILFSRNKAKFPITISLLDELKYISEKTTIGDFLRILNYSKIDWRSWDEKSLNFLTIRTKGDVLVLFDLASQTLDRIVYFGVNLERQ